MDWQDLPSKTEAKMEAGGAEGLRFFLIRGPLLLAVRVLPQDIELPEFRTSAGAPRVL